MEGCDDNSNIQVGDVIHFEVTPRKSNCAIFRSGTSVQACDHKYGCFANILPSVIHNMNQSRNTIDSLYSGGHDGTGRNFVLLHDKKFNPSSGYKHAAHFHQFLLYLDHSHDCVVDTSMEEVKPLAYMVLIECYGGPDHNFAFLANQLPSLGIFLVGNIDNLNATRGCPGISYLNMSEIPMSLLNYGLASLALRMDPYTPEWIHEILNSVSSMKGLCKKITEYNDIITHNIDTF